MFFLVVLMLGTSENTSSFLDQIKDCNHNDEAGCNEGQHKAEELHEAIGMLNAGVDFIFGAVKEEPACHCNDEEGRSAASGCCMQRKSIASKMFLSMIL